MFKNVDCTEQMILKKVELFEKKKKYLWEKYGVKWCVVEKMIHYTLEMTKPTIIWLDKL